MASIERKVYEWLAAAIEAAPNDSALHGAELHDTLHQLITQDFGVRIGEVERDVAPSVGGGVSDYDALLPLVCFSRVGGTDKTERLAALDRCDELEKAVVALLFDDSSLGGRVCDCQVGTIPRNFDSIKSQPYAVANIPLLINPTGRITFERKIY